MSIHYTLWLGGGKESSEIGDRLCSVPAYKQTTGEISATGLRVYVGQSSTPEIEMIEEDFGFTPAARVSFRWDKETEIYASLLRGCLALLEGNTDDAVLLLNGEVVILLRRKGRLVLNPLEGFWTDEVLALIPKPFEFESIMRTSA